MARMIDADEYERELLYDMTLHGEQLSGDTAYNRALVILTQMPTLTPPNEPLTWDELGTMIEKPVYIVEMEDGKSYWALVYTVSDTGALLASAIDLNDYGARELYGKSWFAYRRPPEGEEDA